MWPGSRPTFLPGGILIHPAVWSQQACAENWGLCPFVGRGVGSPSNTVRPGSRPTSVPSRLHLDSSSRLATTDMAENWGLCPCGGGELGPHLTQFGDGRGLLLAKFLLDPFRRLATIDMDRGLYGRRRRRSLRL